MGEEMVEIFFVTTSLFMTLILAQLGQVYIITFLRPYHFTLSTNVLMEQFLQGNFPLRQLLNENRYLLYFVYILSLDRDVQSKI